MTLGHFSDNTPINLKYIAKPFLGRVGIVERAIGFDGRRFAPSVQWLASCAGGLSRSGLPVRGEASLSRFWSLFRFGIRRRVSPLYAAGPAFKTSIVASPELTIAWQASRDFGPALAICLRRSFSGLLISERLSPP